MKLSCLQIFWKRPRDGENHYETVMLFQNGLTPGRASRQKGQQLKKRPKPSPRLI
jgi:hypothetical protein